MPLFLNAEPASTGVTEMSSVAARSARLSISGVTESSSRRYVSISSSSWSATASISWWWYSWACSTSSDGISPVSIVVPRSSDHVFARIDDVDAKIAPERRRRSRRDRDAALLLLRHPVHDGSALVDLAHLVGAARVVEDPLGRRGLARVDVGHDPDVADALECYR